MTAISSAPITDACAVQVPAKLEPNMPAPQMGEPSKPVEITYWIAAWQAAVNGRGDSITDLYPNASIDHYPFKAASLEPDSAAQDLIAEGPGTLAPAPSAGSKGRGRRTPLGWAVVIVRRPPNGFNSQSRSQIAFAVWEGSRQEAGAVKMRIGWIPLAMQAKP